MGEVKETIQRWSNLWLETDNSHNLIEKMIEITGKTPDRALECFVYGADLNAMSTPFLMPVLNRKGQLWSDEMFLQTIIHELLHIFVTTNSEWYWNEVQIIFAKESVVCRNHIIVYALLYEIYQQLFNTEPADFSRDNLSPGYMRAIELVKEFGHRYLIEEYQRLT